MLANLSQPNIKAQWKYLETLAKNLPNLETLGKNLGKILTKSAKNMYDLARSCQELQEKYLIFSTEKTHKKAFGTKNLSGKTKNLVKKSKKCQKSCQEMPRILPRIRENPRISGKKQDIIGWLWMKMHGKALTFFYKSNAPKHH